MANRAQRNLGLPNTSDYQFYDLFQFDQKNPGVLQCHPPSGLDVAAEKMAQIKNDPESARKFPRRI